MRFQDGDVQTYPVDLYPLWPHSGHEPLTDLIGHPFPFPTAAWESVYALHDPRLRKTPLILVISQRFAEPYAGAHPAPDPEQWARALATRLPAQTVAWVEITPHGTDGVTGKALKPGPKDPPNYIHLSSVQGIIVHMRSANGRPMLGSLRVIDQSPTVFVLDKNELVRAVFEGQDAWDMAAIERAARDAVSARP